MNTRILAVAYKEILQILRDKRTIPMILLLPVIQVILFGYVAASDVQNIRFAAIDQDHSELSREIVTKIDKSGYFINQGPVDTYQQLETMMDEGTIKIGLVIPAGFYRSYLHQNQPKLQVLIDGTDSNTASIAQSYFLSIINSLSQELATGNLLRAGMNRGLSQPVVFASRIFYNPELRAVNFMVPGVTAMVLLLITTMLTALSVVKEKEQGTIEQLMVTPVKPWELICGKLLPFPVIGLLDAYLTIMVGVWWFKIPIRGSLFLLFGAALLFILTTLGMGLLISTISSTQQQAMLSTIFFFIPNMLLSGFIFPITNMPRILQYLTYIIPGRYFLEIIRGIYLKGIGIADLYPQMLSLTAIGVLILLYSVKSFHKQLV